MPRTLSAGGGQANSGNKPTTHVEALVEMLRDAGSIPAASTPSSLASNRKVFFFRRLPKLRISLRRHGETDGSRPPLFPFARRFAVVRPPRGGGRTMTGEGGRVSRGASSSGQSPLNRDNLGLGRDALRSTPSTAAGTPCACTRHACRVWRSVITARHDTRVASRGAQPRFPRCAWTRHACRVQTLLARHHPGRVPAGQ